MGGKASQRSRRIRFEKRPLNLAIKRSLIMLITLRRAVSIE